MKFGERLRELRKSRGIAAEKIANEIGASRRVYVNWEAGRNEPSIAQQIWLADYFGVSLDYLVGRIDNPRPHPHEIPHAAGSEDI